MASVRQLALGFAVGVRRKRGDAAVGIVSVIAEAPIDHLEGTLEESYGFGDLNARAHVDAPLADTLAFDVSAL